MEREDYQKRINDLLDAVSTLLDSNRAMGERVAQLEKKAASSKRKQHLISSTASLRWLPRADVIMSS